MQEEIKFTLLHLDDLFMTHMKPFRQAMKSRPLSNGMHYLWHIPSMKEYSNSFTAQQSFTGDNCTLDR